MFAINKIDYDSLKHNPERGLNQSWFAEERGYPKNKIEFYPHTTNDKSVSTDLRDGKRKINKWTWCDLRSLLEDEPWPRNISTKLQNKLDKLSPKFEEGLIKLLGQLVTSPANRLTILRILCRLHDD